MTDSFYVELMSNSPFQDNTIANFKNKIHLLRPLEGKWEVSIVEISYTKSWKNLRNDFDVGVELLSHYPSYQTNTFNSIDYFPDAEAKRRGVVRAGHYESAIDLCREIEKEMFIFKKIDIDIMPKFHFDNITKNIYISPGITDTKKYVLPHLNDEVSGILGYDNYTTLNPRHDAYNYLIPDRPADIDTNLRTLFVYCDIVEPQYVGHTRAKLLRTIKVPYEAKFGTQVVVDHLDPHYVPVLMSEFETIEINIKDDTGATIPFMFGRTRVKLHLRPKK